MSGAHEHPEYATTVDLAAVAEGLATVAQPLARLTAMAEGLEAATAALTARVAALEGTPEPEPDPTPDPDPEPEVPPAAAWTANGLPLAGQVLAGATVKGGGETEAAAFEQMCGGHKMGVRRSFWQSSQVASAVATAKADLAAGRIPWVSFKLPGTGAAGNWARVAAGSADAWAKDAAARLAALDGPVWLAIHHEPEGDPDGTAADWVAVQRRLSPIFRAHPSIAYSVIVQGWPQFLQSPADPQRTMAALWPGREYVDLLGVDPYNWYGSADNQSAAFTELSAYTTKIAAWCKTSGGGVPWGIAETGYTDTAAAKDAPWLTRAFAAVCRDGGVAFAYYHYLMSANTWPITGPKVAEMTAVLAAADRWTR